MKEIKSPDNIGNPKHSVFLGGTIDMGNSKDWQKEIKEYFKKYSNLRKYTLLNPRRNDWDSSWIQSIDNPQFREHVEWELNALENSDVRLFVFLPDSKSPITMLELGLFFNGFNIVYCPNEFYKSGNIHIVCEKYHIPYYTDWDEFLKAILKFL